MNNELDLNIDGKYYNNLDVVGFSQMIKDPSYCYTFYWLEAIVKMISRDVVNTSFNDIIDEIICNAWYTVFGVVSIIFRKFICHRLYTS